MNHCGRLRARQRESIPLIGTQARPLATFGFGDPTKRPPDAVLLRGVAAIAIVSVGAPRARGRRPSMTQTNNRFFDEIARLMNDAAGVAQGVRREFDTLFRTQAERWLHDLDLVKREEFEAVKDMARLAREENEALKARLAALEAKLGPGGPP
jgi:BMFP domain-containing protein YqiC